MSNKINIRDLINVGLFTAIYIVLFFMCLVLAIIPVLMLGMPFATTSVGFAQCRQLKAESLKLTTLGFAQALFFLL